MIKKIIFGIIIAVVIIGVFFYFTDPLEINRSLWEKAKTFYKSQEEPGQKTQRLFGIPSKAQVFDSDFTVEEFVIDLDRPTSIAFVGADLLEITT